MASWLRGHYRLSPGAAKQLDPAAMDLAITTEGAELRLPDEASLFVPRAYARITDLVAQGENARALLYGSVRRQPPDGSEASLPAGPRPATGPAAR